MAEEQISSFPASLNVLNPINQVGVSPFLGSIESVGPYLPADVSKIDAELTSISVDANYVQISPLFPVGAVSTKKYLMRCKNLSTGQPVYWLVDFLDKTGSNSGIPSQDISDVCLVEVVC